MCADRRASWKACGRSPKAMRRGPKIGPGTIPALSWICRTHAHPSCLPSALKPIAFPERVQSLGGLRRKASLNETRAPAKFSGTSVNNAVATSVHNPFRATIGFAETTSSKPSSIDSFRAPACDKSPERAASPTPPSDASPTASGVIASSFMRSFDRKEHRESPWSWMAFAVLNTANTGRWTSTCWSGPHTSFTDSTMRSFGEVA